MAALFSTATPQHIKVDWGARWGRHSTSLSFAMSSEFKLMSKIGSIKKLSVISNRRNTPLIITAGDVLRQLSRRKLCKTTRVQLQLNNESALHRAKYVGIRPWLPSSIRPVLNTKFRVFGRP